LLTGIGRPWSLTTDDAAAADIAYAPADASAPTAAIRIDADAAAWESTPAGAPSRVGDDLQGDVLATSFALLSGRVERTWPRDRHGHHLPPNHADGLLPREAVVSQAARALDRALSQTLGPPSHKPWPIGKSFAAVSTHDVDYPETVRWLEPFRVARRAGTASGAATAVLTGRLHHWHFDSWLDAQSPHGVRPAFFFVARRGSLVQYARGTPDPFYDVRRPRFRRLLQELASRDCEIALQPSYRAWERPGAILREKAVLEEALGAEVCGSRHHYWHLDPEDPEETLLAHEEAGLLYDCSLTFERLLGWRRGLAWPFHPFVRRLRRGVATLQVPTVWMDDQVFGHAAFNDTPTEGARIDALDSLVDRAAALGGVFVSDIHEYVFDEALFPQWRSTHERIWNTIAGRGDAWIATPAEVARRWLDHETNVRAESTGLT
jgi:hypothetical protein